MAYNNAGRSPEESLQLRQKIINEYQKDEDFDRQKIAEQFGITKRYVRKVLQQYRNGKIPYTDEIQTPEGLDYRENVQRVYDSNSAAITTNSLTINTLEQALEIADVDMDIWEVDRWVCNSWGVTLKDPAGNPNYRTNFQVKVWLKRIVLDTIQIGFENFIKEDLPKFKAKKPPLFTDTSEHALEISLIDAHMGKLAWGAEVGRDYDLKIACRDYTSACEKTLAWSIPFKPEKIFFIVGNDLMHIENFLGVTTKGGNVLDTDSRLPKIAQATFETVTSCIYSCRSVAPVEVLWIPGNHDMIASMFLCMMLKEHFKDDDYVTVDCGPMQRKARLWGNLLVGWTHQILSRHNAWVNELAHMFKEEWAAAKYYEWHYGHKHKKNEIKMFPIVTEGGVLLRQLTALSPIDAWHFENLFTDAVPGGEAFVWSKKHGVVANFTAWT